MRVSHSKDADFVENVVIVKTALLNTSLPEVRQKWSQRRLLLRIFHERFNGTELE
ncbi:unnamed protein product [Hymenolepis diminuta]|uniref:Uncharacterized protein n=1 Tax=Hymenolepis diminuta TaxID=6216 RepID=A0A564Y6L9_HYMDI|nr:unnamed protein product [Hymenolepis diminuta]